MTIEERIKHLRGKEKEIARRLIELTITMGNKFYMIRQLVKDKGEK